MRFFHSIYKFSLQAIINEDVSGNVTELQLEIKKLKELVAQLKGISSIFAAKLLSDFLKFMLVCIFAFYQNNFFSTYML